MGLKGYLFVPASCKSLSTLGVSTHDWLLEHRYEHVAGKFTIDPRPVSHGRPCAPEYPALIFGTI